MTYTRNDFLNMTFRVDFVPTTGIKRPYELRRLINGKVVEVFASYTTEAKANKAMAVREAFRQSMIK